MEAALTAQQRFHFIPEPQDRTCGAEGISSRKLLIWMAGRGRPAQTGGPPSFVDFVFQLKNGVLGGEGIAELAPAGDGLGNSSRKVFNLRDIGAFSGGTFRSANWR